MQILFFTLVILSVISYYLNKKDIISPSFLFSLSFLFASFFALLNDKKWAVNLSNTTYIVIAGGVAEFILVGWVTKLLFSKSYKKKVISYNLKLDKSLTVKMIIIEIIQLLFIYFIVKTIKQVTGQSNIVSAIFVFNSSTNGFIDLDITLPTYIKLMQTFITAFGVFGEYLFARAIVLEKKFNIVLFLETLIGLLSPLLNGSRGGTIFGLVTFFVFLYMIKQDESNNPVNNTKYIMYGVVFVGLVLVLLEWSATIVGRNVESIKFIDYISTYVGAEIKNLDIFINQKFFPINEEIWGQQTFYTVINFLIKHANLAVAPYNLDLPFRISNGYGLGNVATTFYPWIYDFGYQGVFWLTLIMSVISEYIYQMTKRCHKFLAPLSRLFYGGTIVPCVTFAFFSNKFYESMDIIFITLSVIIWIVSNYMFSKESNN